MPYQFGSKLAPSTKRNSRVTPKSITGFPTVSSVGGLPRPKEEITPLDLESYWVIDQRTGTSGNTIASFTITNFSDDLTKAVHMNGADFPTFWVRTWDENTLDFVTANSSCFKFDGNRYGRVYSPQNFNCLKIDNDGNVYLGTNENISVGVVEASIYAFSTTGTIRWTLKIDQLGSTNNRGSAIYDMRFDSEGNIIVAGEFSVTASSSANKAFVVKVNKNNGSVIWERTLKPVVTNAIIRGLYVDVNDNDNIYYTGGDQSVFPDGVFFGKMDSNGNHIYTKRLRLPDAGLDYGYAYAYSNGILTDSSKNVILTFRKSGPGGLPANYARCCIYRESETGTAQTCISFSMGDDQNISLLDTNAKITSNGDVIVHFTWTGDTQYIYRTYNNQARISIDNKVPVWHYRYYTTGGTESVGSTLGFGSFIADEKLYTVNSLRDDDDSEAHLTIGKFPPSNGGANTTLGSDNEVFINRINSLSIYTESVAVSNAANIILGTGTSTTANGTTTFFSVANTYPDVYVQTQFRYPSE
jgi:hypothetical protein